MRVYLIRHGIAVDPADPSCPPHDADRPLTAKGRTRTAEAAAGVARLGCLPDVVWCSPYIRAQQTASIMMEALDLPADGLDTTEILVPHARPRDVVARLQETSAHGVMLVGHAPHLDNLLATMVGASAAFTALGKASLVIVEWMGDVARVEAIVSPRLLRALGA